MSTASALRNIPPSTARPDGASRGAVMAVLAAMALVVIDAAMMNVALPTIANAFEITAAKAVRIVTAYQIAIVMFLLPCAAFGEAFGLRKTFLAGLMTFAIASAFAASGPSFSWLIVARFVQGVGAAAIMALGVALLRQALPEARLGTAIGWNAVTVALCSAAGPTMSAAVLTFANWHMLFLVHLPLAALALWCSRALPSHEGTALTPDPSSIVLSAAAFGALFVGLGAIATATPAAALLISAAVACFWVLGRRSQGQRSPVIPLDLLRQQSFRLSAIASTCCFVAQTAGLLAVPFYLQDELGLTPLMTGVYMTPWPAAVALSATASALLLDRYPKAPWAPLGSALLALGLASAAVAASRPDPLTLASATALCGLGFGFFQVANNRTLFLSAVSDRSAAAGGLQGTARLTGQATGAIIVSLLFACMPVSQAPRSALAIGSLLAAASAIVSARSSAKKLPQTNC